MCMCTRTYTYTRTHTRAAALAISTTYAYRACIDALLCFVVVIALACLLRARAQVHKDAPRWSKADVYDRDLR